MAGLVATNFGGLDRLQMASREELVYQKGKGGDEDKGVKGIGEEIAGSIVSFFEDEENRRNVRRLIEAGLRFEDLPRPDSSLVSGKAFVITGQLSSMTRGEAKERIQKKGGRLASTISGRTNYLVVGESPGSKLEKARSKGISLLNEDEFLKLIEG